MNLLPLIHHHVDLTLHGCIGKVATQDPQLDPMRKTEALMETVPTLLLQPSDRPSRT